MLFPGQGSQAVGMGKSFYESSAAAREALDQAEATLPGLLELMWTGPDETLRLTENQQPALLAVGYAAWRTYLEAGGPPPSFAAGHSLGEWTAHVASGTLQFQDALSLVRLRGRYMQEAVPEGKGAMAAVLKLDKGVIAAEITAIDGVEIANLNAPGQTVISGLAEGVAEASARLRVKGGRVIPLKVSAPFHTNLMRPAAERLALELAGVSLGTPAFPVFANVTASPETDPQRIRALLLEQITAPVRWVETLQALWDRGVRIFLELGLGAVLTSLATRTLPGARAKSLSDPSKIREALA